MSSVLITFDNKYYQDIFLSAFYPEEREAIADWMEINQKSTIDWNDLISSNFLRRKFDHIKCGDYLAIGIDRLNQDLNYLGSAFDNLFCGKPTRQIVKVIGLLEDRISVTDQLFQDMYSGSGNTYLFDRISLRSIEKIRLPFRFKKDICQLTFLNEEETRCLQSEIDLRDPFNTPLLELLK